MSISPIVPSKDTGDLSSEDGQTVPSGGSNSIPGTSDNTSLEIELQNLSLHANKEEVPGSQVVESQCNYDELLSALEETKTTLTNYIAIADTELEEKSQAIADLLDDQEMEEAREWMRSYLETDDKFRVATSLEDNIEKLLNNFSLFKEKMRIPRAIVFAITNLIWASSKGFSLCPLLKKIHQELVNKYGKELAEFLDQDTLAVKSRINSQLYLKLTKKDLPYDDKYLNLMLDGYLNGPESVEEELSKNFSFSCEEQFYAVVKETSMNLETEMNKLSDRLNEYRHEGKQKLLAFQKSAARTLAIYFIKDHSALSCLLHMNLSCVNLMSEEFQRQELSLREKLGGDFLEDVTTILYAAPKWPYLQGIEKFLLKIFGTKFVNAAQNDKVKGGRVKNLLVEEMKKTEPEERMINITMTTF